MILITGGALPQRWMLLWIILSLEEISFVPITRILQIMVHVEDSGLLERLSGLVVPRGNCVVQLRWVLFLLARHLLWEWYWFVHLARTFLPLNEEVRGWSRFHFGTYTIQLFLPQSIIDGAACSVWSYDFGSILRRCWVFSKDCSHRWTWL